MIKYASEIKFVKDRYTTPVTIEFSSLLKLGDNTINTTAIYCKISVNNHYWFRLLLPFRI